MKKQKTFMQEARLISFGLANFECTKAKHSKPTKYDEIIKNSINYDGRRAESIEYEVLGTGQFLYKGCVYGALQEAKETNKNIKSALRMLKTMVNQTTFGMHSKELASEIGIKTWSASRYATKYYVQNYKEINRDMKKAFLQICRSF